jgi:hypothetical protein
MLRLGNITTVRQDLSISRPNSSTLTSTPVSASATLSGTHQGCLIFRYSPSCKGNRCVLILPFGADTVAPVLESLLTIFNHDSTALRRAGSHSRTCSCRIGCSALIKQTRMSGFGRKMFEGGNAQQNTSNKLMILPVWCIRVFDSGNAGKCASLLS